jgi:hypothetical protein
MAGMLACGIIYAEVDAVPSDIVRRTFETGACTPTVEAESEGVLEESEAARGVFLRGASATALEANKSPARDISRSSPNPFPLPPDPHASEGEIRIGYDQSVRRENFLDEGTLETRSELHSRHRAALDEVDRRGKAPGVRVIVALHRVPVASQTCIPCECVRNQVARNISRGIPPGTSGVPASPVN